MRCKVDGIEVEGNVDEIIQLVKQIKAPVESEVQPQKEDAEQKTISTYTEPIRQKVHRIGKLAYKKALKEAVEFYQNGIEINKALTKALGRNPGGYDRERFRKVAKISKKELRAGVIQQKFGNIKHKRGDVANVRERLLKVTKRANEISKEKGIHYFEALKLAHKEIKSIFEKPEVPQQEIIKSLQTELKMPKVIKSSDEINKLLIDMLGNVARFNGKLQRHPDGDALMMTTKYEWDELIDKVFMNIVDISAYLTIENKFKIVMFDDSKAISYG